MKLLLKKLERLGKGFYSIHDIEKVYVGKPEYLPVLLHRLTKNEKLTRIMRGYYTTDILAVDWEAFACTLKQPSYLSLEYALYHHGLIDQVPETLTLITSGKSRNITCHNKELEYSHVREDLYFGYEIVGNTLIATKEKALLDMAYLVALSKRSFRFTQQMFDRIDREILKEYMAQFPVFVHTFVQKHFEA